MSTRAYGLPASPARAYGRRSSYGGFRYYGFWAGGMYFAPGYHGYRHQRYSDYNSDHGRNDSAWNSKYGDVGRYKRKTDCVPNNESLVPNPDLTAGYAWGQVALGVRMSTFASVEFEVDLFRDLAWRSPCNVPTQVLVSRVCQKANLTEITPTEMDDPRTCSYQGSVDSVHAAARRRLLQANGGKYVIVEFMIGVDSESSARGNDLLAAAKECFADQYSEVYKQYKVGDVLQPNGTTKGVSAESAWVHQEFVAAGGAAPALLCVLSAVAVYLALLA